MLAQLDEDKGFTLIELMIVIAIIGVLAAIAIPQFSSYRTRSFNSAAQADLRNVATAQVAYYTDKQTYASHISQLTGGHYGYFTTPDVILDIIQSNNTSYVIHAWHTRGDTSYRLQGPGGSIEPFNP